MTEISQTVIRVFHSFVVEHMMWSRLHRKKITFHLPSSSDPQDCRSWVGENCISLPFLQLTLNDFFEKH